jgi:hypothetical protein
MTPFVQLKEETFSTLRKVNAPLLKGSRGIFSFYKQHPEALTAAMGATSHQVPPVFYTRKNSDDKTTPKQLFFSGAANSRSENEKSMQESKDRNAQLRFTTN